MKNSMTPTSLSSDLDLPELIKCLGRKNHVPFVKREKSRIDLPPGTFRQMSAIVRTLQKRFVELSRKLSHSERAAQLRDVRRPILSQ